MLINCYYYAPHNHVMLSDHIKADLGRMVELGTDIVSLCLQESQITNWHWKRVENFIDLAHRAGLKVHAVPNRWAGLFAGWLDGFGAFTVNNPHLLVEDEHGRPVVQGEMACCVNKPEVREHIEACLRLMFRTFAFDGVIWDEPHAPRCHCRCCREAGIDSQRQAERSFSTYLDEVSFLVKALGNNIVTGVFVQPDQGGLLEALTATRHIDYLGSDGHLRSDDHRMHRMKGTIFEAHRNFYPLLKAAGKKTFFLIEGQRHRDEDLQNYLDNLDRAFSLPMEQLMYYFSAHEMSPENEAVFNRATWAAVKKLKSRRPDLLAAAGVACC